MITLLNSGDLHRLDFSQALNMPSEIIVSLKWHNPRGALKRIFGGGGIDLDLGCYYKMRDGSQMLIDGLQFHEDGGPRNRRSRQGCFTEPPYIWHAGDNRGSGSKSQETIIVNPRGLEEIEKIIIYSYIYEGASRWCESQAAVTIDVPGCEQVQVKLDQASSERFCAIVQIDFEEGSSEAQVRKLLTFHNGHSGCDRAYGWGFKYHPKQS